MGIIRDWFDARLAEGTPTKNINTEAPFLTLAHLYERDRNPVWLPYLDAWAEWVMAEMPRTRQGGWQTHRPGCGSTAGPLTAIKTSTARCGRRAMAGSPS